MVLNGDLALPRSSERRDFGAIGHVDASNCERMEVIAAEASAFRAHAIEAS
jgi:hypothetical protein